LDVRRSITSVRSTGSKLVTFEDEHQRKKPSASIYDNTKKPSLDQHRVPPKSNYDRSRPVINNNSDEDVTISNAIESDDDEDQQPTRPGVRTDIQPSPRKNLPPSRTTSTVGALVIGNIKPSTTIPAVVKAKPTTERFNSDRYKENLEKHFFIFLVEVKMKIQFHLLHQRIQKKDGLLNENYMKRI
jgi:hypothetical protein